MFIFAMFAPVISIDRSYCFKSDKK